jgi:hypothetical protein
LRQYHENALLQTATSAFRSNRGRKTPSAATCCLASLADREARREEGLPGAHYRARGIGS